MDDLRRLSHSVMVEHQQKSGADEEIQKRFSNSLAKRLSERFKQNRKDSSDFKKKETLDFSNIKVPDKYPLKIQLPSPNNQSERTIPSMLR